MRREARGSGARLLFFVLCLAVGVGAVVSVNSFSDGLDEGIRKEARSLLAADLSIRSRRPIDDAFREAVRALPGSQQTEIAEMLTVVAVPAEPGSRARSQLTEVKAVDGEYPFYGNLELEPAQPLAELLAADTVIVAPELLRRLELETGSTLRIGGQDFRIAGTVLNEPDRIGGAFSMGPRIFLSEAGL
jgi:putative ABC transport system permease protein